MTENKSLSVEELRSNLEQAEARMAETDAAIVAAGKDIDEQVLSDLEARFAEEEAEAQRLTAAIDRRERMETALQRVPRAKDELEERKPNALVREPLIYRKRSEGGQHSFFQDLYFAQKGDGAAVARLQRHQREKIGRAHV